MDIDLGSGPSGIKKKRIEVKVNIGEASEKWNFKRKAMGLNHEPFAYYLLSELDRLHSLDASIPDKFAVRKGEKDYTRQPCSGSFAESEIMGKHCSYYGCKTYDLKLKKIQNPKKIFFIPFPKETTDYEKCKRWINAVRPLEDHERFRKNISRSTYICSAHFVGQNGPTAENPDPEPLLKGQNFEVHPNAVKADLQYIGIPVGWSKERLSFSSYVFTRKCKDIKDLQCIVREDLSCEIKLLNCTTIPSKLLEAVPRVVSSMSNIIDLLNTLTKIKFCTGIQDKNLIEGFSQMNSNRKGRLSEHLKSVVSADCEIISNNSRCSNCTKYRRSLMRVGNKRKVKKSSRQHLNAKIKLTQTNDGHLIEESDSSELDSDESDIEEESSDVLDKSNGIGIKIGSTLHQGLHEPPSIKIERANSDEFNSEESDLASELNSTTLDKLNEIGVKIGTNLNLTTCLLEPLSIKIERAESDPEES